MTKIWQIISVVGALSCSPYAAAQSKYGYLYDTTAEILRIDRETMVLSADDIDRIATRACKTLGHLLKDPNFRNDIQSLHRASETQTEYSRRLSEDLLFFVDSFIPEERKWLHVAGITDEVVINRILIVASALRGSLRETQSQQSIMENVDRLRQEVCLAAERAATGRADERAKKYRRAQIKRWGIGFAGVTLIAVDALALGPSSGVAAASFLIGGSVISAVTAEIPQ